MAEKLITSARALFSRGRTEETPARKRPGRYFSFYTRDENVIKMLDSFRDKPGKRNKFLVNLLRKVDVIKHDVFADVFGPDPSKRIGEKAENQVTAGGCGNL